MQGKDGKHYKIFTIYSYIKIGYYIAFSKIKLNLAFFAIIIYGY